MSFRKYTKAIVIVHGKSELDFVKHIKSKLRLPLEIYSRSNGKTSIQISSINDILKNRDFKTKKCFKEKFFKVECDKKGNPKNVKIFIIMDIDDTSQEKIDSYKSSTLFVKDWKKDFIVPIWNDSNFEEVLNDIGYWYAKNDKEKRHYKKLFSVERGEQDVETIKELRDKLISSNKSNLDEFLTFCIESS